MSARQVECPSARGASRSVHRKAEEIVIMLLRPSATLRERTDSSRFASGDGVFRFFLGLSLLGCLWSTVIEPRLPAAMQWLQAVLGS